MHMSYSVDHWGSHPDDGNDDCWRGQDFATLEEAREFFEQDTACTGTKWIILAKELPEGSDGRNVRCFDILDQRRNPNWTDGSDDEEYERMCRSERAMQAGMAFGCDGYNDEMGY